MSKSSKAKLLAIGIDRYDDHRALSFCSEDAIAVVDVLKERYPTLNVQQIGTTGSSETDTSYGAIISALSEFKLADLGEGDVALFYFAGHGVSSKGRDYLVCKDSARSDASTMLPVDDVVAALVDSGAGMCVLVLDACRNISARADNDFGRSTADLARRRGVIVFFGCSPGEVCQELAEFKHGIFTSSLVDAFKSASPSTALSIDSIVIRRVREICNDYNLDSQSPYTVVAPVQKAAVDLFTGKHCPPVDSDDRSCIIIAGPPNSGKSTAGQYLARTRGYVHLEMSSFAWQRYDGDGDSSISIQEYMERVVWRERSNLDVIARDLITSSSTMNRVVICGPRTVEEIETLRAERWHVELVFLHASSDLRFRWYLSGAKRDRWGPRYLDVIERDYRELSWGLARIPQMASKILVNENSFDDLYGSLDGMVESRSIDARAR